MTSDKALEAALPGEAEVAGLVDHADDILAESAKFQCHECIAEEREFSCHDLEDVVIVEGKVVCKECVAEFYPKARSKAAPDIGKKLRRQRMFARQQQARAEKAERERDEASQEMRGLLNSFVREHFPDNTEWRPLDDLVGMITQMNNACTVARDYLSRAEAAEARVKELEEEVANLRAATNQSRLAFSGMVSVQSAIDLLDKLGGSNG